MKEILVLAVCLGVVLIVLWVVVVLLEKVKEGMAKEGLEGKETGKEEGSDNLVPVILAGIMAYDGGLALRTKKKRRVVYKGKEEKVSWWRMKERMKQTQKRGSI